MSTLNYPEIGLYNLPKKNILVISCIDLRLTDNLVDFLNFDNLHNRYDHFALAGTSLTWSAPDAAGEPPTVSVPSPKVPFDFKYSALDDFDCFKHWKKTLSDHINLAVALHHIKDVYIVEHQDCGAYKNFLHEGDKSHEVEKNCHAAFAKSLAEDIHATDYDYGSGKYRLGVHTFYIDLRGNVTLLDTFAGSH